VEIEQSGSQPTTYLSNDNLHIETGIRY